MEGGYLANRATRLEGLRHSVPLHATHLTRTDTGTVNGLRELSLEWPLSITNKMVDQRNFFILFQLPTQAQACSLPKTIVNRSEWL